ncbi:MAG: HAD family phosphatase [Rikenellaceae bacterium]
MQTFPEHLIFDFGGVLLDIDIHVTIEAFEKLGIEIPDKREIHPNNSGIFLAMELGEITPEEFINTLISYAKSESKPTYDQVEAAWNALLLPFNWSNFELLDELRCKGHKTHLLSNTNLIHHLYFEELFNKTNPWGRRFDSFFDSVHYSDVMKMRKPNLEIYERVAQLIGSPDPSQMLFIDDNAPNLDAPASLGWRTHHLKSPQTVHDLFNPQSL